MTHYINKDALVAEIEKRIKEYQSTGDDYWFPVIESLKSILSSLDTLEVEEVDLEKEMSEYFVEHPDEFFSDKYKLFAKHFFELGIAVGNKAQKGEKV